MKNLFVILNNHRDDNLGDQVISRQLAEMLSRFGEVRILGEPKGYHRYKGYPERASKCRIERIKYSLLGYNLYRVMNTGGWGNPTHVSPAAKFELPGARIGFFIKMRKKLSERISFRNIAIGLSLNMRPENDFFDNFYWVGVRDKFSLKCLLNRGLKNCGYFPDLSFYDELFDIKTQGRSRVAISFREFAPDYQGKLDPEDVFRQILRIVAKFPTNLKMLPFFQVEEDRNFNQRISRLVGYPDVSEKLELESYRDFYRGCTMVISNRLHCLMLGAVNGAVPVLLAHKDHTKTVEYFKSIGWDELIVDVSNGAMAEEFSERIVENMENYRNMVLSTFDVQRRIGDSNLIDMCRGIRPKKALDLDVECV